MPSLIKERIVESGCSISVVYLFWEQEGRVRFSAPRPSYSQCGNILLLSYIKIK